jgi:hypothetical protein
MGGGGICSWFTCFPSFPHTSWLFFAMSWRWTSSSPALFTSRVAAGGVYRKWISFFEIADVRLRAVENRIVPSKLRARYLDVLRMRERLLQQGITRDIKVTSFIDMHHDEENTSIWAKSDYESSEGPVFPKDWTPIISS